MGCQRNGVGKLAYTIYDETPRLSSSSAGPISYHPTINYYDFRTTLGDDIISNVLNIVQSDIPTVVNYYDFREGYNGDDCSPNLLSIAPSGQTTSVLVNYCDARPNDYGILSLSNVLKYIYDLTDVYYYRYDSESGDSIFLDHITVPEQPVNHIIDSGERPPITGRENGHTYHQCDRCMKKFKSPDFWRQHFQKDSCIRRATI
ncbi:8375_t:CDS:2 [Gigaspora rosea]|nr:8375_t:CDS:2 [Gigaspora rosea]